MPVIEFRASIVLGPGSLSFEMIRTLTERLPVMITPRWVSVPAQPIAIQDLLRYLIAGLDHAERGQPHLRNRRCGPGFVRGLDPRVCPTAGPAPAHHSGADVDTPSVEPLAGSCHASVRPRRPQVDREHSPPDDRARRSARREFAIEPIGHRESIAAILSNEDEELVNDPMVRRAVRGRQPWSR